jgi:hypothetical protein
MLLVRPFAITTPVYIVFALICLALAVPHLARGIMGGEPDHAPTPIKYAYYDFESGEIPFADTLMPNSTPTSILADPDGNQFLRMTVSPSDCGPNFYTSCPKTRAELFVAAGPNTHDQIVTYSFSMRIPSRNPADNHLLVQGFQGYRMTFDYGRTFWLGTSDGEVFVQNDVGKKQRLNLGPVQYDTWVHYELVVNLTSDPDLGRIDVYKDAELVGSITKQATERTSQYTSDLFLNVVDFKGSSGTADFDNVQLSTGDSPHKMISARAKLTAFLRL